MADQFTDLGFRMEADDAMERYFAACWDTKEIVDLEDGLYLRWQTEPGICCWLSVDRGDQSLLDWDMHFVTEHQNGVAFDADLALDEAGQSGNIRMLLHPGEEGETPVVASAPALAYWPDREPGSPGLAQLACYAEELTLCAPQAQPLLEAAADEPELSLTGRVTGCRSLVNAYSRCAFWHLTVEVCGAVLGVLCADTLLASPVPAGSMIHARCRVTAMVESGVTT